QWGCEILIRRTGNRPLRFFLSIHQTGQNGRRPGCKTAPGALFPCWNGPAIARLLKIWAVVWSTIRRDFRKNGVLESHDHPPASRRSARSVPLHLFGGDRYRDHGAASAPRPAL